MSLHQPIELFNFLINAPGLRESIALHPDADKATVFTALDQIMGELDTIINRARRLTPQDQLISPSPAPDKPQIHPDAIPTPGKHRFELSSEAKLAKDILNGETLVSIKYNYLDPVLKQFYVVGTAYEMEFENPNNQLAGWHYIPVPGYQVKVLSSADREFLTQYINARQ